MGQEPRDIPGLRPSHEQLWDSLDPFGTGPHYFDKQGNPITMHQWSDLRHERVVDDYGNITVDRMSDYARIGWQEFEGGIRVSTVWLGMDHGFGDGPPVLFETMIFSDHEKYPYNQAQTRYVTEEEASEGHRRTCNDVERGVRPWFLDCDDDG